ncbi:MAG TPA: hypothetical protein PLQ13_04565 [Candidatus Krumholzibacteria bacterium]|nr:hypothetical protein [Candidatus Krumholzibacteria bacterium]
MTRNLTAALLALAVAALLAPTAAAQTPRIDPLAQQMRIEAAVRAAGDLTEAQRAQMMVNLEACRQLGLDPDAIAPCFPGGPDEPVPPATALRLQSELIRAGRADLPLEPLLAKIREGRMKNVPDAALVAAAGRVNDDMAAADRLLRAAAADGLTPAPDPGAHRHEVRVVTRAMWRGLTPEDGARLQARARERLGSGPCATADLAAAAETAVRIREEGADPEAALELAGLALARGYTADDLAELGRAVVSGRMAGGDVDRLLGALSGGVEAGLEAGALGRALQQAGWMGPAETPGAGGRTGGSQGTGPDGGHNAGGSGGGTGGSGDRR